MRKANNAKSKKEESKVKNLLAINYDFDGEKMVEDIKKEEFEFDSVISPTILECLTDEQKKDLISSLNDVAAYLSIGLIVYFNKLLEGELDGSMDSKSE